MTTHKQLVRVTKFYPFTHSLTHSLFTRVSCPQFTQLLHRQIELKDEPKQRPKVSAIKTGDSSPLYHPFLESKNRELQNRMMEAQTGSHTVRSHGFTVARTHMHYWLILLLLVVIDAILNIIHPFYRYVGKDMMSDLKFPLKSNTVLGWAVPIYAVALPTVIFLIFYFRRRDVYDIHHGVLGLLFSVLVTAVITDAIKDAVGRPRPDFFWHCFPDGKDG